MASEKRLPILLGSEPEIKLNEKDIADKIKSNFMNNDSKSHVNIK
jgi:hypothetical protein